MNNHYAVGLLGARGLVGESVSSLLVQAGHEVYAFSRNLDKRNVQDGVNWLPLVGIDGSNSKHGSEAALGHTVSAQQTLSSNSSLPKAHLNKHKETISNWLCVAPIWILPDHFNMLEAYGVRRIVALSSYQPFYKRRLVRPRRPSYGALFG